MALAQDRKTSVAAVSPAVVASPRVDAPAMARSAAPVVVQATRTRSPSEPLGEVVVLALPMGYGRLDRTALGGPGALDGLRPTQRPRRPELPEHAVAGRRRNHWAFGSDRALRFRTPMVDSVRRNASTLRSGDRTRLCPRRWPRCPRHDRRGSARVRIGCSWGLGSYLGHRLLRIGTRTSSG